MTNKEFTPSHQSLSEALILSEQIIQNIELSELPLSNIALKTSRLARILGDFDMEQIFKYEASGYPLNVDNIVPQDSWALGGKAGRHFESKDEKGVTKPHMFVESISQLESNIRLAEVSLASARDVDTSISSANPSQYVMPPPKNVNERIAIRQGITAATQRLASRTSLLHNYALEKYYELKYSGIADDIFTRIRTKIDTSIGQVVPDAVKKFTSVYTNLASDNPEDWSNAVHSCRKILQDLADALYPARDDVKKMISGKEETIKMGKDNYINRLIAYIEEHSGSDKTTHLIGSHLRYMGERLDSVFGAAQKGSHTTIISKEEADRYVVYTYLLTGDIISLQSISSPQ